MDLKIYFQEEENLGKGIRRFFEEQLSLNLKTQTEKGLPASAVLKDLTPQKLSDIEAIYFGGKLSDQTFQAGGDQSTMEEAEQELDRGKYESILVFGVELIAQTPTRSRLAEITRWLNRKSLGAPVVVVFRYNGKITFANAERTAYIYKNREGEKAGKVSLLKDVDIDNPHTAQRKIILGDKNTSGLRIDPTKIKSFQALHDYWRKVLNTKELNKDFYNELFKWYLWAKQNVKFPNSKNIEADKNSSESLIRFISRILFVWFMKEKGLVSPKLFDPAELKSILKQFKADDIESNQYYTAVLQNLFFATLNMPVEQRSWISKNKKNPKQDGNPLYYRYEDQFLDAEETIENLFNKVPFLNGGLFDCLDDKKKGIVEDGFTRHKKNQPVFPNHLFFGVEEQADISEFFKDASDKNKWKAVKIEGIISLFEEYKFTIEENTPLEEDIALDPELLGKVFENLLASYNPETGETARKQTGSFYTPREIVNYMVDESLKAYLENGLLKKENYTEEIIYDFTGKESRRERKQIEGTIESPWLGKEEALKEKLNTLFDVHQEVNPFDQESTKEIVELIDHCKILDPACGSGAFPMGILLKLVDVLHKLDPENELWKETQIERVNRLIAEAEGFSDPSVRKQVIRSLKESKNKIEEAFRNNELNYGRKLFLIQNCIYGVDIQPIAIQISKLRFFISLLVDQTEKESEPNRGFEPLPNMDFKLIAANTLIGAPKNEVAETYMADQNLLPRFQQLTKEYFSISDPEEKNNQKEQIAEVIHEIVEVNKNIVRQFQNRLEKEKNTATAAKQKKYVEQIQSYERDIQNWESFENIFKNESVGFFEPSIFYPEIKDGFDVVIGNPPYRPIQKYEVEIKKDWSNQEFKTYSNSGNIYFLFFEIGLNIIKTGGSVIFITSNQWMRNISGEPLRKFFLSKYCPEILIDFRGTDIFENVAVLSNILMVSNKKCNKPLIACDVSTIRKNYQDGLRQIVDQQSIRLSNLSKESWLIFDKVKHTLREQVIEAGTPISKWNLEIYRGILTGFNDAFYLDEEERKRLLELDVKNEEIIKPILRGKDLVRYSIDFEKIWLIFTRRGIKINEYPEIKKHLFQFHDDLMPKNSSNEKRGRKPGKYEWYEIQDSINYYKKFEEPKMIFMNMSKDLIFSYDPKGEFLTNQKCFIVTGENIRYLTAFFNSKLFRYFFKDNFPELLGDVREVSKVYFEKIPVKKPENKRSLNTIENLVELIVHLKMNNIKLLSNLEKIIEGLIIEIYFPDHMKERSIYVLEFVERDIAEVMRGQEFGALSDPEKEAVIEQMHALWSDPENEVVKRMGMFKERSPEILKVILES